MKTFTLLPDQDSYAYQHDADDYNSERFEGAVGRYARLVEGPMRFTCRWTLNEAEYIQWLQFFRFKEKFRTPFQIDLISDDGYPEPHVAKFVYNTFSLVEQSGNAFTVACDLLARVGEIEQSPCVKITEAGYVKITEAGYVQKVMEVCPAPASMYKITEVEIGGLIYKETEVTEILKITEKGI